MYFKQFYLGCLAHASYLIGSGGEAIVVDPQRDVDEYMQTAAKEGLKIKYIIETHLHADFVSGHQELKELTGAEIVFGCQAGAQFPHKAVKDGDKIEIGDVVATILETPGHTFDSICILLEDKSLPGEPKKVLTGDTLFIGDVGRPDLVGVQGSSQEKMAGILYDSLKNKLLTLPDDTEVYPAHGAGSLCGKNMSTERSSTIGKQKQFNYALKAESKEEFISLLCENLPPIPQYFPVAVAQNKKGAVALKSLPEPQKLSLEQLNEFSQKGYCILDVRSPEAYGKGHFKGAINISLGGQFATWCGTLIPNQKELVVICESKEQLDETIVRLARCGHESVVGYYTESIEKPVKIAQISVQDLQKRIDTEKDLQIIDVRRPTEYGGGHVPKALNLELIELADQAEKIAKDKPTAVICRSGYRSSIASSILEGMGLENIANVTGGTNAWIEAGFKVDIEDNAPACSQSA